MIKELQRSSSWTGKLVLFATTVLAMQLHTGGAPERALATSIGVAAAGSVLGLGLVAIVVARLLGKNIGLITSDRAAMVAVLVMVAVKIAIARIFLPL